MKRKFENWINAYLEYSAHSEAPDQFHYWTAISVIAGALRRKVWIDQGYFQWTPNFYVVFVAPPGIVSKSTTASIGMRLLREIPEIHFGPDAVTWQSLVQSLANSTETFSYQDLQWPMSAITIVSSEFGTFLNPKDREMVDVLVSLWDGQVGIFEKATKMSGNDRIENPWVNILACTTPAWIAGNFPEYMIGGGFTSRAVFVYAETKRHLVAYPADHIPLNFQERARDLTHDLEIITTKLAGEYKLSDAARKWGIEWYQKHYDNPPLHLNSARFGGYIARKQTHIHKLAMVCAAAQSDELIIEDYMLKGAAHAFDMIEDDMPRVFAHIGKSTIGGMLEELREYVRYRGKTTLRNAYRLLDGRATDENMKDIIASLVNMGYIRFGKVDGQPGFYWDDKANETSEG